MKPDRIDSLTGLRGLAMLTVFCSHLNCLDVPPFERFYSLISNGRVGVHFFLVLSGFVLALGYSSRLNGKDMARDVRFVRKRISKLYIPYLITMILAIPLYIINVTSAEGSLSVKLLITRLLINIGMIQSAIPFAKYSVSINDVAWFISTVFIIYLFTPCIIRVNNIAAKHYTLPKMGLLVGALLVLHCAFYMVIGQIEFVRFADLGLSILYRSPLLRIFPFLIGIAGYNICSLSGKFRIKHGPFVEIPAIAVFLIWWVMAYETGLPTVVTECISMLVALLVILVFSFSGGGIVSDLLSRGKMFYLGKISLDFYLVHYLVIRYGTIVAGHFGLDRGSVLLLLAVLYLAISLGGASMIHFFNNKENIWKNY